MNISSSEICFIPKDASLSHEKSLERGVSDDILRLTWQNLGKSLTDPSYTNLGHRATKCKHCTHLNHTLYPLQVSKQLTHFMSQLYKDNITD